ncbi:hypothetical protein, partial [Xenorhabdus bovienii]|uniref:hypothetical protein n=1 Tax=Xenorhabdus bovienii TaxID=40576 RepID=UPI000570DC33
DVGQFIAFLDQRGFAALLAADHHVPRPLIQVVIAVQMALQLGFPVIEVTGLMFNIDPHRINPFQLDVQIKFFQLAQAVLHDMAINAEHVAIVKKLAGIFGKK